MKKVTLLISRLEQKGGLEKYSQRLAVAFANKGCLVTILTTQKGEINLEGVRIISLCKATSFSFLHLLRFQQASQKWLKNNPQDVIFAMERTIGQTHLRAGSGVHQVYLKKRAQSCSLLKRISFFFNPLHRLILFLEKKAFEDPSLKILFANSEMVRNEILHSYRTPPEKICVVHNGVEWAEKGKAFEKSVFSKTKEQPFEFLFVGNDYHRKGLKKILEALALLQNKNFILNCVGKEKNPAFFQKLTATLGLKDRVFFYGQQADLTPFYQKADALILASLYDPFSNVTLEALAMGLLVISSRSNGGHEILTAENGLIIEDLSNPNSIAKALSQAQLCPKNKLRADKIRQSVKEFDFSKQLDKIVHATLNN